MRNAEDQKRKERYQIGVTPVSSNKKALAIGFCILTSQKRLSCLSNLYASCQYHKIKNFTDYLNKLCLLEWSGSWLKLMEKNIKTKDNRKRYLLIKRKWKQKYLMHLPLTCLVHYRNYSKNKKILIIAYWINWSELFSNVYETTRQQ
ncbi:hypothetical protein RFI_13078 [Reticulomyxa filosa]|uniref:Uncharacterized protein n=1 Tax=Reticulomyxa filosa TaxID=46433 RepID=X6NDK1_RETFI|nr:hypothetical protein RFI_13078 [Reticulomyxa filosa]|eukprot:ETO24081.1 hypothetical protein RFI_13078 [Reticulomyxa filosa]